MSDLTEPHAVETPFGTLLVRNTDIQLVEAGSLVAGWFLNFGGDRLRVYHVVEPCNDRGLLAVEQMDPDDAWAEPERRWFDDHDHHQDGVPVVVATMYDNDGGRAVHHPGQVRYGGAFVCMLRDAADQLPPMDGDADEVLEVFDYGIDRGLVVDSDGSEPLGISDEGWQLLQTLQPLYPQFHEAYPDGSGDWRDDPSAATEL